MVCRHSIIVLLVLSCCIVSHQAYAESSSQEIYEEALENILFASYVIRTPGESQKSAVVFYKKAELLLSELERKYPEAPLVKAMQSGADIMFGYTLPSLRSKLKRYDRTYEKVSSSFFEAVLLYATLDRDPALVRSALLEIIQKAGSAKECSQVGESTRLLLDRYMTPATTGIDEHFVASISRELIRCHLKEELREFLSLTALTNNANSIFYSVSGPRVQRQIAASYLATGAIDVALELIRESSALKVKALFLESQTQEEKAMPLSEIYSKQKQELFERNILDAYTRVTIDPSLYEVCRKEHGCFGALKSAIQTPEYRATLCMQELTANEALSAEQLRDLILLTLQEIREVPDKHTQALLLRALLELSCKDPHMPLLQEVLNDLQNVVHRKRLCIRCSRTQWALEPEILMETYVSCSLYDHAQQLLDAREATGDFRYDETMYRAQIMSAQGKQQDLFSVINQSSDIREQFQASVLAANALIQAGKYRDSEEFIYLAMSLEQEVPEAVFERDRLGQQYVQALLVADKTERALSLLNRSSVLLRGGYGTFIYQHKLPIDPLTFIQGSKDPALLIAELESYCTFLISVQETDGVAHCAEQLVSAHSSFSSNRDLAVQRIALLDSLRTGGYEQEIIDALNAYRYGNANTRLALRIKYGLEAYMLTKQYDNVEEILLAFFYQPQDMRNVSLQQLIDVYTFFLNYELTLSDRVQQAWSRFIEVFLRESSVWHGGVKE